MRNTAWRAVFLLILLFGMPGSAQVVVSAPPSIPEYSWLEDSAHAMDIENVQTLADTDWTPFDTRQALNLGFSDSAFWLRIVIPQSARDDNHVLEIGYPLLDVVDMFWTHNGQLTERYETGDIRPFHNRPVVHRNFVFPVPFSADTVIAYIKIESQGPIQVPIKFVSSKEFVANEQLAYGWQAMFFGIIVALALYNLFLFLIIRDQTYLWYVLAVLTLGLVQLNFHGVLFQWYWPDLPEVNRYFTVLIIGLSIITAVMFAIWFLNVRRYSLRGYQLLKLLMFCSGISIVYGFFGSYQMSIVFVTTLAAIGAPSLWLLSLYIWWRGLKLAIFYALAWTPLLFGNLLLAISKMGYMPRTIISESVPQIGVATEAILWSFALAYRINQERHQRLLAQNQTLEIQREANRTLEQRVRERTEELQQANERLEAISLTDGLTQIANRRQLDEQLQAEWNRSLRHQQPLSFLLLDIDHFKSVNDKFGHLAGDDCLIALAAIFASEIQRTGDVLARYGGEEFGVLLPATPESGARLMAEQLRQAVERSPVCSSAQELPISLTISVGFATMIPEPGEQFSELIRRADEALYAAKKAGRNRACGFQEAPTSSP